MKYIERCGIPIGINKLLKKLPTESLLNNEEYNALVFINKYNEICICLKSTENIGPYKVRTCFWIEKKDFSRIKTDYPG